MNKISMNSESTKHSEKQVEACIQPVSYTHLDVYKRQFKKLLQSLTSKNFYVFTHKKICVPSRSEIIIFS